MSKVHCLSFLYKLQLKILLYTLPLVLLGITFWVGGELVTKQLLSRPYKALDKLQADLQLTIELKLNTTIIAREIYKEQEFTHVEVKTGNSGLKKLEFELPITPSNPQEATLIQQLAISAPIKNLKKNTQLIVQLPITLQVIKVEIEKARGLSKVEVISANSLLTKLEFEFPVTEVNIIETMIAKELGISHQNIRKLVRYQINR